MYGIFAFLGILENVPGCNWSITAYDSSKVGHLMSLFAFSLVVAVGPFALLNLLLLKPFA